MSYLGCYQNRMNFYVKPNTGAALIQISYTRIAEMYVAKISGINL